MGTKFQSGDRVEYFAGNPNDHNPLRLGKIGTISEPGELRSQVRWDDGEYGCSKWRNENLRLIEPATQEQIDAALATLRSAGEVMFKLRKPPFVPVRIQRATSSHNATVFVDRIEVGCQRVTFEKFDEIAAAVAKAREYAAS